MNYRSRFTCRPNLRDEGWRDWVEWEGDASVHEFAQHIEELLDQDSDYWESEWCANLATASVELPFRFREALYQR